MSPLASLTPLVFPNGYDLAVLVLPASVIFLVTIAVSPRRSERFVTILFVAFARSLLFVGYYALVFNSGLTHKDDVEYLRGALQLLGSHLSLGDIAAHPAFLTALGGSQHFLYYLQNVLGIALFGFGYYAPAALNICLAALVARVGSLLAENHLGIRGRFATALFACLSLNADIVTWSLVMNGKDIFVLLLTLSLFYGYFELTAGRRGKGALILVLAALAGFVTRYYMPFLFAFTVGLRTVCRLRSSRSAVFMLLLLVAAAFVLRRPIRSGVGYFLAHMGNPVTGIPRYLLTPFPLRISPEYSYLLPASILHWLLAPFMIAGLAIARRWKDPAESLIRLYLLVTAVFYGLFPELQGPRHRVQLDGFLTLYAFVGLLSLASASLGRAVDPRMKGRAGVEVREAARGAAGAAVDG